MMQKISLRVMKINPDCLTRDLRKKFDRLTSILNGYRRYCLAFSGGVDSAFLLAAGAGSRSGGMLAITLVSRFFTPRERERAGELAARAGIDHEFIEMDVLSFSRVVKNDAQRCYFCKQQGFSLIKAAAAAKGISTLIHGINRDDLNDYRPGIAAAEELGFRSPLVDAGFTKQDIRTCSRRLGLETWNLPSQSCLATRIPVGDPITGEALERIEKAEALLRSLGFSQVRVRCHGTLARIEALAEDLPRLVHPDLRQKISSGLKGLGFTFVSADLDGYSTGKMNAV